MAHIVENFFLLKTIHKCALNYLITFGKNISGNTSRFRSKCHFCLFTYFNADGCGCQGLEILRVQQVAAVRRQHLYDPDGKPFSLTRGIRGRGTRLVRENGRSLRSCPLWIAACVGGAALRGLAA